MKTYILVADDDSATTATLFGTLEEAVRDYFDRMKDYSAMDEETKDKMRTLIQEMADNDVKEWDRVLEALDEVWSKMKEEDGVIDTMYVEERDVPVPDGGVPEKGQLDRIEGYVVKLAHGVRDQGNNWYSRLNEVNVKLDKLLNRVEGEPKPERTDEENDIAQFARECFEDDYLQFDDEPLVSMGDENGAFVQCWKWVSFDGTIWDKDKE